MGLFKPKYAEAGSARWWRRVLMDVGLRLGALVFLVVALSTRHYNGGMFWFGVVAAILMALLLIFPAAVLVLGIVGRFPRGDASPEFRVRLIEGPSGPIRPVPDRPLPEALSFYLDDGAEIPIWLGSGMLPAAWLPVSGELLKRLTDYQQAYENLPGFEGDPWPSDFLEEGHRLIAAANRELIPKGHRVTGKFEFDSGSADS